MVGAVHRVRPWKKLAAKADAGARVRSRGITEAKFRWKTVSARKCADGGRAEAGERRAALAELAESELDEKKNVLSYAAVFTAHKVTRKVKGK